MDFPDARFRSHSWDRYWFRKKRRTLSPWLHTGWTTWSNLQIVQRCVHWGKGYLSTNGSFETEIKLSFSPLFYWRPIIDWIHIFVLCSSLVRTMRGLDGVNFVNMIMCLTLLFLRSVHQNSPNLRDLGMCGLRSLILNQSYMLIKEKHLNLYGKTWQDHYILKKWMIRQRVEVAVWLHILQERVKHCCWFHFLSVTWKFTQEADHWSLLQKLQSIHGGESLRNGAFRFLYMCSTTLMKGAKQWGILVQKHGWFLRTSANHPGKWCGWWIV